MKPRIDVAVDAPPGRISGSVIMAEARLESDATPVALCARTHAAQSTVQRQSIQRCDFPARAAPSTTLMSAACVGPVDYDLYWFQQMHEIRQSIQ